MISTKEKVEYISKRLDEIKIFGEQRKDQRAYFISLLNYVQ